MLLITGFNNRAIHVAVGRPFCIGASILPHCESSAVLKFVTNPTTGFYSQPLYGERHSPVVRSLADFQFSHVWTGAMQ